MGRLLTAQEHSEVLQWAEGFRSVPAFDVTAPVGRSLRVGAKRELDLYWSLAALSRAGARRPDLSDKASRIVFRVRVLLEGELTRALKTALVQGEVTTADLFDGSFFGCSIKQGVSLRVPLASCVPTRDCHASCYAHDGMDAGRNPVVKGVLNGVVADRYECGDHRERDSLRHLLSPHVRRAVSAARAEARNSGFDRQPRIRFSHVGEIAAFPTFANDLARLVHDESGGEVACVVYTRHPNAKLLDPDLIVTNFTVDRSSRDRIAWAPPRARLVYSAWDGQTSDEVAVNFVEHHRFGQVAPAGAGKVCPVTVPESTVRTCDAARCTLCFDRVASTLPLRRSSCDEESA